MGMTILGKHVFDTDWKCMEAKSQPPSPRSPTYLLSSLLPLTWGIMVCSVSTWQLLLCTSSQFCLVPSCRLGPLCFCCGHDLEFQENSSPPSPVAVEGDAKGVFPPMQVSKRKNMCDRLCQMLVANRKESQEGKPLKRWINLVVLLSSKEENFNKS